MGTYYSIDTTVPRARVAPWWRPGNPPPNGGASFPPQFDPTSTGDEATAHDAVLTAGPRRACAVACARPHVAHGHTVLTAAPF